MADGVFKKILSWIGVGAAAGAIAVGAQGNATAQTKPDTIEVVQPANPVALSDSLQSQLTRYITVVAKLMKEKRWANAFEVTNDIKYSARLIWQQAHDTKDEARRSAAIETLEHVFNQEVSVLNAMYTEYEELKNGGHYKEAYELSTLIHYYSGIVSSEAEKMGFKTQAELAHRIGVLIQKLYKTIEKQKYCQEVGIVDFDIKEVHGKDSSGRSKRFKKLVGLCVDKGFGQKKAEEYLRAALKDSGGDPNALIQYHFNEKKGFWEIIGFVEVVSAAQAANLLK